MTSAFPFLCVPSFFITVNIIKLKMKGICQIRLSSNGYLPYVFYTYSTPKHERYSSEQITMSSSCCLRSRGRPSNAKLFTAVSVVMNTRWHLLGVFVAVVELLSRVWLFVTLWTAARQASRSFTVSWSLHKLMSIESVMPRPTIASLNK